MNRSELREAKRGLKSTAGNVEIELAELEKMQGNSRVNGIETITVGCGAIFTIVCC